MEETPRQYKKRIDEKWERNEKNRDKLIHQIEKYELVDEEFKTRTKQEILSNFEKNEKAEKETEQYKVIVSELENIDKKYGELAELKEKLKSKKQEKAQVDKEIRGSKLDGSDETTLKMQMASVRKLKERLEILKSEIEELEKDIENREQEIKEIEETYGKKQDTVISNLGGSQGEKSADDNGFISTVEMTDKKPSTLKEYHEQTVQDLWNKDRTRGKIFEILEEGAGIDDKLKDKIEKEISDRFFEYYDEKQGSLRMKSARHLKNKLNLKNKTYEEMKAMPDGEEKIEKLKKYERIEKAYGQRTRREIDKNMIDLEDVGIIGGKPCVKAKRTKNGLWTVIRGDKEYSDDFREIGEIKEIGGKPCFKAKLKNDGRMWTVFRGFHMCGTYYVCKFDKIGKIKDIGGEPCFKAKTDDNVYRIKGYEILSQRSTVKSVAGDILEDILG